MKKIIFALILISIIPMILFSSGCTSPANKPIIQNIKIDGQQYLKAGEKTRIGYEISNPLSATFVGKIEYRYDETCMGTSTYSTYPQEKDIEVPASKTLSMSTDFSVRTSLNEKCYTDKQEIVVVLKDKSGEIFDFKSVELSITKW